MSFKRLIPLLCFLFIFQMFIEVSQAEGKEDKPNILIVYMTKDDIINERIHFIEATLAAFAEKVDLVSANQFNETSVKQNDVLVFVGDVKGNIPMFAKEAFEKFEGQIVSIGENTEQLLPFNSWRFSDTRYIRNLDGEPLSTTIPVVHSIPPKGSEIISVGEDLQGKIPFIVKNGRLSFIATTSLNGEQKYAFSRSLYEIMEQEQPDGHTAYIRLEDISPLTDPKKLKEAGEYLAEQGIPFYMSVVPVANSQNGKAVTLSQQKELVQVIKDLQSRGGMIIANGYSHSYRFEEQGGGFEFWDIKMNQRISTEKTDQTPEPLKVRSDFSSEQEYRKYVENIDEIEKRYIEEKMTNSIEEMTELGLYPVAFEAPNYAMSSNGYRSTAKYFSSIFGQIQFSDEDRRIVEAPLFVTEPAILHGMKIYPDTIGYVNPALTDPLQEMKRTISRLQTVPGSMIGGSYHSYLGNEYLPQLVNLIESVPNVEWLDLRETEQSVKTENVTIKQATGKPLEVTSNIKLNDRLLQQMKDKPFDFILWILAACVAITITVFLVYILRLKTQLRKRLFEERK
ncbi:DUF2334 domain-containing protein [Bacillus sp. JJ722]|uniref:DUF2334 domain-containing protein n=1 Tax=Bacillus sp. JJ722 TaxID=3122973 RepID=UPI002FFE51CF